MKILVFVLAFTMAAVAYNGPGTADFAVMRLSYNARPIGMGEAFTAMAEGAYGLGWNPAGMIGIRKPQVLIGYRTLPVGVQGGMPAYVRLYKRKYAIGFAVQYINYGEFEEIDGLNRDLGKTFSPFSFVGITGIAKKINKKTSAGVTFKGIYERLYGNVNHKGAVMDLGVRYLPDFRRMGLAAVVQNIGMADTAYNQEKKFSFSMPIVFKIGMTNIFTRLPKSRFAFDIVKPVNNVFEYRIGVEHRQSRRLYLRGGYSITQPELERFAKRVIQKKESDAAPERVQSWSLGAGYKTPKMSVNYGLQSWGLFKLMHALSLLFYL